MVVFLLKNNFTKIVCAHICVNPMLLSLSVPIGAWLGRESTLSAEGGPPVRPAIQLQRSRV